MERREFLGRAGVAVGTVAPLAGCTSHSLQESEREPPLFDGLGEEEVDLPVPQPLGVAASAIERASEETIEGPDAFEAYLDDAGVDVRHVEETTEAGEPVLSLEYAEETAEIGLMDHLGTVAGGYASLVDAGHESEKLTATLLDAEDEEFGEYEIRRDWAVEYNDGELTAREYANEIAVTVEGA